MLPLLALFGGVALFIVGFLRYRRYRLLRDSPFMPIRSVAMGLVHVSGKAAGAMSGVSPLTQLPCYYYHVLIEETDRQRGWRQVCHAAAATPFYLEDATGKVLVNPKLAQFDLAPSFQGVVGPTGGPRQLDESLGVPAPTEAHLRAYLADQLGQLYAARIRQMRAELQSESGAGAKMKEAYLHDAEKQVATGFANDNYRLTEYCLVGGRTYNVMGTCTENPSPADEHDRNLITQGQTEKTFNITDKAERKAEKKLRSDALVAILVGAFLILLGAAFVLQWAGAFK